MLSFTVLRVSKNLIILTFQIEASISDTTKDLSAILIDTSAAPDQTGDNLADLHDDKVPEKVNVLMYHCMSNVYQH